MNILDKLTFTSKNIQYMLYINLLQEVFMMKKTTAIRTVFFAALLLIIPAFSVSAQSIDDLSLYTEEYPPFNFEENGELRGITIDLMDEMLERAGSSLGKEDIQLVPWNNGYQRTQNQPNTALFATTRTAQREEMFKWVGPIAPTTIVLTAKKSSNISINGASDINQYSVGTVRADVGEQLLQELNVSRSSIDSAPSPEANVRKLAADRIDLWAYEASVAKWLIKSHGYDPNEYEAVYTLSEGELYFAFNPQVPQSVLNQLQNALDDIKADGTYQEILDTYLK
ncbi:MAG TPA: transporter substrate-binding domain-containing protein [Sediminispirochaeta sp.]|nr:transporter substrate-binding domain-containing protein [Sediminispirochaeta sp.]